MDIEAALLNVVIFWILTTPHEFAHAWVATRLGDDTPRLEGRLTLNPLAHVDWLGTVILPLVTSLLGAGFLGWGRAVNCNPAKLRGGLNGLAMVAMAGPASNVLFGLVLAAAAAAAPSRDLVKLAATTIHLSLYLAIFNMIPVPPLDGSKLLLAARVPFVVYQELARFGFLMVMVAMSASSLGVWMNRGAVEGTVWMLGLFGVR